MLAIVDVYKQFRGVPVLRGVSLGVARGELLVLRGRNGSGKSTLCEIATGVLDADRGSVTVDGWSIRDRRARASIGYAPSSPVLPEHLHVYEWCDLAASLRGTSAAELDRATHHFGVEAFLDDRLAAISLGQRRRLLLACATLGSPELLVLDEPTVGLDAEGVALLASTLRTHLQNGAALVATHDADWLAGVGTTRATSLH